MDRYLLHLRTKELMSRIRRLNSAVACQAEESRNQKDALLVETTACLTLLAEFTIENFEEFSKLIDQCGACHDLPDEVEYDEVYMSVRP
ncbi:MAG: hypothetical protein KGZ50_11415 [Peptococcaceae bacterium]|nr:hypothetical protein [Peptococcaceae bacterium]